MTYQPLVLHLKKRVLGVHSLIRFTYFPVPDLISPVGVSLVSGVSSESGAEVEEATVGDAVLVIEPVVEREDLPFQSTVAFLGVPARGPLVEYCLG